MKELYIKVESFEDIRAISDLATAEDYEVVLTDGQHTVNAKSLMCIFCLNVGGPLLLRLDCGEEDFESFRRRADRFIAN